MKGFMLIQDGFYLIPDKKPMESVSNEPIYYRYVDYHTERDCLYYIDNSCFQYIYHQYKNDVREGNVPNEAEILVELCAMEIMVMAMVFGDSQKPHKYIRHYKELTEHPLLDMESKEVKATLTKALKDLKDIRTEYECMENYIRTVDKNIKEVNRFNKGVFSVSIDMTLKSGFSTGKLHICREKMEILGDNESATEEDRKCFINPASLKQNRPELHSIEFSYPNLYIKAFEKDLRIDILTQRNWCGIKFAPNESSSEDDGLNQYKQWRKCVAMMFFYANLEYPRSRKEPCPAEVVDEKGRQIILHDKSCPLIAPNPPVHFKLTRQDVRMILKRYGTQDGWYMFNTFDAAPKLNENQTTGEISLSYCMDEQIHQMTVTFSQEIGFGPPIYRIDAFRGKKFCSLFELASHFSINGKRLEKFITDAMVKDINIPGHIFLPTNCIKTIKTIDDYKRGTFYSPLDDSKHNVRLMQLPKNFWYGLANTRVLEIENMVRSLCDANSIHQNLIRLFGICNDNQGENVCQITEDFGVCLHDYLRNKGTTDSHDILKMAHQIASGIYGLHERQIVHGFPVLHNCLVDPITKVVKVGGVGILRISIATQRLDGERSQMKEQPSFKLETVPGEPRYHPARWLPKESLFDHHFNELTDRWCFGIVLWQMFNKSEIPLSDVTDAQLVELLHQEKEYWYKVDLEVKHDNKSLEVMLEKTIDHCLKLSCVESMEKVVRLLDLEKERTGSNMYTFANMDDDLRDLEELEIEEIDGLLWFKTPDYDCNLDNDDSNYKEMTSEANYFSPYNSIESIEDGPNQLDYDSINNNVQYELKLNIPSSEVDVIESIKEIEDSDIILTETIIGQGNFASVKKGILRTDEGTEVAVKMYHPDIKAIDIQKEIDAMTQLKHDYIIPLKGVYRRDGTAWLIMNFYKFGSLDKYIEQNSDIPVERLCLFASQIAEGMKFLSNENYIHRDLSTRNVLVQNQYKVRISDLGLSRSVEKQYYKHKTGVIPYLWYPPEFFETHTYGKSLDVWSYGITCCEIFNNAEVPYLQCEPPIRDIKMLKDFFDSGRRLAIPNKAPEMFRIIITNCWKDKADRWTFNDIVQFICERSAPR
ncbi:uncharacterized protein LOC134826520 [Bolinopsis microptera]|uniref:uncharacterized protein LOC134826520 n=1 Tax=Bolinopsis microptera TaxID=2820187 RepID=UPI0030793DCB